MDTHALGLNFLMNWNNGSMRILYGVVLTSFLLSGCGGADQDPKTGGASVDYAANAARWVETEFSPSTLDRNQQLAELGWFTQASKPFRGMEINVVSETLTTHEYESETLTKAFFDITGIKVTHDLIQEGDVIEKLQTQMQSGENVYDAYVNDSDLIGTHARYGYVVPLSDFMAGEGAAVTSPTLDLDDFIGISFTTGPDGKIYQLPDQQFANLYWFRYDWFSDPELQAQFEAIYGYPLGVPVNWSAYEDIAEFFSVHVNEIDGVKVFGHMDYGKKDPSLGWRFTDAWLSMAGAGDKGIPNGLPVDEWGIRVEGCRPVRDEAARDRHANIAPALEGGDETGEEGHGIDLSDRGPAPGYREADRKKSGYAQLFLMTPDRRRRREGQPFWTRAHD